VHEIKEWMDACMHVKKQGRNQESLKNKEKERKQRRNTQRKEGRSN
jgi:hypothetical protein